jgi:hypothetical protein
MAESLPVSAHREFGISRWQLENKLQYLGRIRKNCLLVCLMTFLHCADHIVRRKRPPDPLQLELTDRLDLHEALDLR